MQAAFFVALDRKLITLPFLLCHSRVGGNLLHIQWTPALRGRDDVNEIRTYEQHEGIYDKSSSSIIRLWAY